MSVPELDYLRFAYNCLSMEVRIAIQKVFPGLPPINYYINLCDNCKNNIANIVCQEPTCGKLTCVFCSGMCLTDQKMLCSLHADKCNICKVGCGCLKCRKYITDSMCNTCSENDEISYTCGCLVGKSSDRCIYCGRKMDPVTKERVN